MSGLSAIHGFDRQRLILALILAATALYLVAVAPGFRYRRAARTMAVTVYAAVFIGVCAWIVLWFTESDIGR
ncbi:MAG TPA: hypothetical protein VLX67_01840 [Stellaceae bacterium]|nr:hypothetical protein [Stellaceae bacterium]